MRACIFDIKHFAINDGPGIRQTIFFKGCPLKCAWCHNPESFKLAPENYLETLHLDGNTKTVDRICGKYISRDILVKNIKDDIVFYKHSKGGVTFSGGEPMMQFDFLQEITNLCKEHQIHTCIDTSGYAPSQDFISIAPKTDLFLFDLKIPDPSLHKKYTGVDNKLILDNLFLLDELGSEIVLRYPFIPGLSDSPRCIEELTTILEKLNSQTKIEILPYHNIANHKYKRFNIENFNSEFREPSSKELDLFINTFQESKHKIKVKD